LQPNDPENPFNYPRSKKLRIYGVMLLQMCVPRSSKAMMCADHVGPGSGSRA
jgi:hypothetical protein